MLVVGLVSTYLLGGALWVVASWPESSMSFWRGPVGAFLDVLAPVGAAAIAFGMSKWAHNQILRLWRFVRRQGTYLAIVLCVVLSLMFGSGLAWQLWPPAGMNELAWSRAMPLAADFGRLDEALAHPVFGSLQGRGRYELYRAYMGAGLALRDRATVAPREELVLRAACGRASKVGHRLIACWGLAKLALAGGRIPEAERWADRAEQTRQLNIFSTFMDVMALLDAGEFYTELAFLDAAASDHIKARRLEAAERAWTALVNMQTDSVVPKLCGLSGRALARFSDGQVQLAAGIWEEVADLGAEAPPLSAVDGHAIAAIRGDAINNRAVALMVQKRWSDAIPLLNEAVSLAAGAVWRSEVNQMICCRHLGEFETARRIASTLHKPIDGPIAAIVGAIAETPEAQLTLYAQALGVPGPLHASAWPRVVGELCQLCTSAFPGLDFEPSFFSLR